MKVLEIFENVITAHLLSISEQHEIYIPTFCKTPLQFLNIVVAIVL